MILKMHISYHPEEGKARTEAFKQWRYNILGSHLQAELKSPQEFEQAAKFVRPEDLEASVHIAAEAEPIADSIRKYANMGFQKIILHNVNLEQHLFIDAFGNKILPLIKEFKNR